jgi:hypothetical protein
LELLAGEGQLNLSLRAADKKLDAEMRFKPLDLLAERRGGDVKTLGGAREMQLRRHGREITQMPDFHRNIMRQGLIKGQPASRQGSKPLPARIHPAGPAD